ncbi:MAG: hypothetical protein IKS41_06795 [Alphaproteobacteria bacterium]|nr:hypothetical protein [Alphaproteobacteria bacterium]
MKLETQKPLFIYDWYGTVEAPWWTVFLIEQYQERHMAKAEGRKYHPTKTLAEFKKQHNNQNTLLIPGMAETIRFTHSNGNNILLSDGNHLEEACPELLALADYFKPWVFDGKLIEFGCKPGTKSKTDPEVAKALIKQFEPNKIFVIGDSNTEAQFAEILQADTFIFCGLDKKQITDGKTLPHVEQHVTGYPMIRYIKERLKEDLPHILKSAQERQIPLKNQNIHDRI